MSLTVKIILDRFGQHSPGAALIALVLIVNGYFLSFKVSPFLLQREKEDRSGELLPQSWQNKIMVSLIISDIGWWGGLALLIIYLLNR